MTGANLEPAEVPCGVTWSPLRFRHQISSQSACLSFHRSLHLHVLYPPHLFNQSSLSACIWNTDLRRQFLPAVMYQRQLGSCFWINRWILPKGDMNFLCFVPGWEPRETVIAQTGLSSVKTPLICFDLMPTWIWILHPKCVFLSFTTFHTQLQMTFPLTPCDRPSLLHISMHHLWGPWKTGGELVSITGLLLCLPFPLSLYYR